MVAERVGLLRWEMRALIPASELRDWYAHIALTAEEQKAAQERSR